MREYRCRIWARAGPAKEIASRFPGETVSVTVADRDSVRDAVSSIEEEFGRLDLLVNNAGIGRLSNFVVLSV
ncbi:MAG: SDR family NAD(P)-dependent oxidoreductase [Mycobacterium sp.]